MMKPPVINTVRTNVLIIGSGGAGVRAAIALHDSGTDCRIIGKCKKREAHTTMAQGGINAALGNMDPKDSPALHAADTIADGGYINDPKAVELLCKLAPQAVEELAEWGTKFHCERDGRISQRFFGAALYRRACFVGDITGKAILNTLIDQATKRKIPFDSETYVFSLLQRDDRVNGALALNMRTGVITAYHAKAVILATGGHSRMFARSSSHFWENNGDGIALATRLGARCSDMEMFQFHPTGMVHPPEMSGLLVTEAVRGEGGLLTNAKGERFMKRHDKERMELSARDVVARANYMEIERGRGTKNGGVHLDISHRDAVYIKKRLPTMYERFKSVGTDISKKKMEVAPTAHYSMGGLLIDHVSGKTDIEGLYAVGEVTAGVHGGNRLGGNSLAEICVFGRLTGERVAKDVAKANALPPDEDFIDEQAYALIRLSESKRGKDPIKAKEDLQRMMWKHAGVIRSGAKLKKGLKLLEAYRDMTFNVGDRLKNNERLVAALDMKNMVPTCEMILRSALKRTESRAAHYRTDFKESSKRWIKNIICTPTEKGIILTTTPVPKASQTIVKALKKREDHKVEEHKLE